MLRAKKIGFVSGAMHTLHLKCRIGNISNKTTIVLDMLLIHFPKACGKLPAIYEINFFLFLY